MLSDQLANTVRTCVAAPGAKKDQPYQINAILQSPQLIDAGKHDRCVQHTEKCACDLLRLIFRKRKNIDGHHKN